MISEKFRPMALSARYRLQSHRRGVYTGQFNWQSRVQWYRANLQANHKSIIRTFARLHYLACHAPDAVRRRWSPVYDRWQRQHLASAGRASSRYLENYTCHAWL